VPCEDMLAFAGLEVPHANRGVHRSRTCLIATQIKHHAVYCSTKGKSGQSISSWKRDTGEKLHPKRTLLCVPFQFVFSFSRYDIPYSNCTIIAPRDQCSTSGSQSSNSVIMAFQMQPMIRVLLGILDGVKEGLRTKNQVFNFSKKTYADLGEVDFIFIRAKTFKFRISRTW